MRKQPGGSTKKRGIRVMRSLPYSAVLTMITCPYVLIPDRERPRSDPAQRGITRATPLWGPPVWNQKEIPPKQGGVWYV
jgi:hypothetical protein